MQTPLACGAGVASRATQPLSPASLPRCFQYHWKNDGYRTFEDYLAALKQSRRKAVRQERKRAAEAGLDIRRLRGDEVTPRQWRSFYQVCARRGLGGGPDSFASVTVLIRRAPEGVLWLWPGLLGLYFI